MGSVAGKNFVGKEGLGLGRTSQWAFRGGKQSCREEPRVQERRKQRVLYEISSQLKLGVCFENIDGEKIGDKASGAKELMILVKVPDISRERPPPTGGGSGPR